MAKFSHAESRRMYSWWWDSHISPKNSKWLQENLTDMDAKVKGMIKLIEEDADSFARRAEMYYKKRPELMKMVEDFYRAYRALAERYDHATGVIRHAHRTMTEAFPNQVPSMFADDSPVSSGPGADPRTREMSPPIGESIGESESVTGHKAMKAFKDPFGHARRELNFDDVEEKENGKDSNQNNYEKDPNSSKSNKETEEIQKLKEALTKLEAEKEAGLVQYQRSLDKLSQLQAEISKTSEDFKILSDHANKAENEVSILKEAITKLESERESQLKDYQLCVDKISNLQKVISTTQEDSQKLNERASTAENEVQSLKGELDKLAAEKDEALNKYVQSLETISNLENKLRLTEEDVQRLKERAERAESEVESLRQTISKLTEEKEATALQYQQCLEAISSLEEKLTASQEEAKRLNVEVDNGVMKLKSAEEQCLLLERSNQSLHSELESLMLKMGTQTQELTEKQKELGRLWACIQEERLRFVEAETAFQTLQHLHAQTQEELRGVASELQNRTQLLNAMETQNNNLHDEVLKVKQENKQLDEVNASSALSVKDMQNEISSLMESKGKLQEEVQLRLDERNALQQEIYCLKEELNDVSKKHNTILDQVNAVGLNPESLESSLKKLQDENSSLKDTCHRDGIEKAALLVKLERLLEKNSLLETSLSDLNAELEAVRGKLEALEQSCQSLLREKSTLDDENSSLTAQLHEAKMNLEKLSENNTVLENSIADAHHQLEALKTKSRTLEDSCQLLVDEKAGLISANDGLTAQLESTNLKLADLGKLYGELEGRCSTLEKENESTLLKVEELQKSLVVERREHANYLQMSETRFSGIEAEMNCLKEESECRKRELDQMLDNAIVNEIEIFVLRVIAQEMKENNYLLSMKNQKLLDESSVSEKKISQLERNNFQQQAEIKSLCDRTGRLRTGAYKLLKVFNIVGDYAHDNNSDQDLVYLDQLLIKLQKMEESLRNTECENLELTVELSVLIAWLRQLNLDSRSLDIEKKKVDSDLKVKTEQVLVMQSEALKLHEMNEELRSKMREEECNKEALMTKIEGLNNKMMTMQGTCQVLQEEKLKIIKEKESLTHNLLFLEEKNSTLEEENYGLCDKVLALENLSLIFRTFADEKSMVFRELGDDRNKLHDMNSALMRNLSSTEGSLNESKTENHHLKERLREVQEESKAIVAVKDQLTIEIENGKKQVAEMALELQKAEEKMNLVEKEKLVLIGCVGESKTENHHLKERLQEVQDELKDVAAVKDQFAIEIENGKKQVAEMVLELQKAEDKINLVEKEKLVLIASVGESQAENHHLKERLQEVQDELKDAAAVKDQFAVEIENEKKQVAEMVLELQKAEDKINLVEKEKLVLIASVGESQAENHHLKERLQEVQDELKDAAAVKDQFAVEIENEKKQVAEMVLELQKAEDKINLVEKEKLVLIASVGESQAENHHLKERLQEVQDELKDAAAVKDQFAVEIENVKKQVAEMVLELQKAEDKINLVEKEKLVLIASVGESKAENHHLKERLHEAQDELNAVATVKDQLAMEIENGKKQMVEMALELQKAEEKINLVEKEKLELNESVEGSKTENDFLKESLQKVQDELKTVVTVKDELAVEIENGKKQVAEMALELQKADEKMNLVEKEKLVLIGCVGESKTENQYLMERLQAVQDELKAVEMFKDQLAVEIENKKKQVAEMELDLQNAERKINLAEKEKLELNESMEDLRNKYDEVKLAHDQQEKQILKLSADNDYLSRDGNCLRETCQKLEVEWRELQDENDKRRIQEENLHGELQTKLNEIDKVETQAASVFGQLQYSLVNQVVYEQKFHEVHEECLGYMDQTDNLKTQLGAYGPEIASLKECISSLENHTDIHVKFQNPENEDLQGAQSTKDSREGNVSDEHKLSKENTFSDLRDLRVRLQAIVKAAVEIKELMVQENFDLHAKLNASTRELELLQSEIGQHRRTRRPTSEITEADSALLTKDIMLDQISDGSSHRFSKMQPVDPDNQIVELWETGDPDGTVGLTVKTKKLVSPSATTTESTDSRRAKSMKKQKGMLPTSDSLIEDDWSVEKLEISKRSTDPLLEGNRRKVLERLDSDVQKLANLQITVQDLKRKLEVIEKNKRGKAVIECEALKGQLEEADIAVIKLFDLNARLMKSIDDRSFSDTKSSSFDQEDDAANTRRRKVSENARRMSEKIGRLQLEVQKLQFVLLKLDDENEARSKISEARRRILLRDYLYGGRTGQRRKKGNFCACIQASSVKE